MKEKMMERAEKRVREERGFNEQILITRLIGPLTPPQAQRTSHSSRSVMWNTMHRGNLAVKSVRNHWEAYIFSHEAPPTTDLHQPLQLVELAVQVLEVVLVQSAEAVVVHDLHQHAERLLLGHLEPQEDQRGGLQGDHMRIHYEDYRGTT
ncbi:hypothetical protein EYF80_057476 [Liparis tanakae]|uniref:Uncharacterized protein n=1 Tax=Liparis tanakae TaxID=230148 RepID=A0A4Z2EVH8_9TELE|nr:hypothetical protein EYF80_057476 [Liparis tanakae]